jgi:hypothetical protein
MSDELKAVLDSTPTSDRMRATAWDLFYASPDPDQLNRVLERINFAPVAREHMVRLKAQGMPQEQPPDAGRSLKNFLGGAVEMMNPISALEGVVNSIAHPIDTISNLANAQMAQVDKAEEAFSRGGYVEGAGRLGAAALPILGPMAADAGETIASGETARGLGQATGVLAPALVKPTVRGGVKAASVLPEATKARAAGFLESQAANRVSDVMSPKVGPNKVRFGRMAEEVAPKVASDMAQNGAPWSREGLHGQISERLALAEQGLDAAQDARLSARTFESKPLIEALLRKRQELTSQAVDATDIGYQKITVGGKPATTWIKDFGPLGQDVVPGPNASRVAVIDQAISELQQLGPYVSYEPIRRLRQAYDGPAKAVYNPSITSDYLKAQGSKLGAADVTGVLREHLAQWDPATAEANATYHLYRTANDVLEATKEIERTRPRVGRAIAARMTGAVLGQQAAGTGGAISGYVLGPALDAALSAGATTQLRTANIMSKLAQAIRAGNVEYADSTLKLLRKSMVRPTGVQRANERATSPSGSQKAPALVPQP